MRALIRRGQKIIVYEYRRQVLKVPVFMNQPLNIILGAALSHQSGWYSTNEQWLDISNSDDWDQVFKGKILLKHVVAEHVFEHLTADQCKQSLKNVYDHLQKKGSLRIAVPDGNHPDLTYLKHVGINGIGADASDHKQLLTVEILKEMLAKVGFNAQHLEGYTEKGELVQKIIKPNHGVIFRSRSNLVSLNQQNGWDFTDANTSLIVDGLKK